MDMSTFHLGLAIILLAIATLCYWFGYFAKNTEPKEKLFLLGRWLLTIAAIITLISLFFIFSAIFAIMRGHAAPHESVGSHGWHGASLILILVMTVWAWVIRFAKAKTNFAFLIGMLVALIFGIYGHNIAFQYGVDASMTQSTTVTTTPVTVTNGMIKIQTPAGYKPHESRE